MQIEVLMGHDNGPSYYQILRNELIIGSSNQCDLVLPLPEVSRRHLTLLVRGDRYFVIDHNSTNGTYIHETRLEPGKKIEWKTNIPMRLATGVILTLSEEASIEEKIYATPVIARSRTDQTRTIVLPIAELKAPSRKSLTPSMSKKKKIKKGMGRTYLIVFVVIGIAYYLNVTKGFKINSLKLRGSRSSSPKK